MDPIGVAVLWAIPLITGIVILLEDRRTQAEKVARQQAQQ